MRHEKEKEFSRDTLREIRKTATKNDSPWLSNQAIDHELALEEASALMQRDMGYLRIGFAASKGFWCRWKWTQGSLAGRYVFATDSDLSLAISTCTRHAIEVTDGKRTASLDQRP